MQTTMQHACGVLMFLPTPPMSLQARAGGVIVLQASPTVPELVAGLVWRSPLFALVMVGTVLATTVAFAVLALQRSNPTRPQSVAAARRLWLMEAALKPWAMGDVAAVAMTSLYFSIQEPSDDFVHMVVRLPAIPMGFIASVCFGVATCGIRWAALPPPPLSAALESLSRQDAKLAGVHGATNRIVEDDVSARPSPLKAFLLLRWELLVCVLWCSAVWTLGPSAPPRVTTAKRIPQLNKFLTEQVPVLNKFLAGHLPRSVGDCARVAAVQRSEHRPHPGKGCHQAAPPSYTLLGEEFEMLWVDGISTLKITSVEVLKEAARVHRPLLGHPRDRESRWGMRVEGQFANLRVRARAKNTRNVGPTLFDDYVCCQSPFHWTAQLSVACSTKDAFHGNVSVDGVHVDPIQYHSSLAHPAGALLHASLQVNLGGLDNGLDALLALQLERLLVARTSGSVSRGASFNLADSLNKIVWFNSGQRCLADA
eukprot:TRINITY_DN6918_c0_g3_i1.p1 TRINITY_DN6918_c0_g3~~TRINITY_DN6918_c0_g3_i1.p1  ORF type:complete len:482 (-),score=83.79 TRINITY_DN6918_c0_g3_i1:53-1498(-)